MKGEELLNRMAAQRLSRRRLLGLTATAGVGAVALTLVGCGKKKKEEKPAVEVKPPAPAPAAPAPAAQAPAAQAPAEQKPAAQAPATAAAKVEVKLADFKVELNPAAAPAGDVTFSVTNNGPSRHSFYVFLTDLAVDQLPLTADGNQVDEEGAGVTLVAEIETLDPGTMQEKTANLKAGRYVIICNEPGHYKLGMHTEFTVTQVGY